MVVNAVRTYDRLPFIDTWRAIAVTLVILAHLTLNREMKQYMQVSRLLKFLGEHGETGVFIFFFISGYVVSKACLAEIATSGGFSISGFYTRRFFRIVPPLLVYLTACLTLAQFELVGFSKRQFLLAAFYLCNNRLADCGWLAGHTWSLAFEEQFYLLFPMILVIIQLGRWPGYFVFAVALCVIAVPFAWPVHYIGRTGFIIIYALFALGYVSARYPIIFAQRLVLPFFLVSAAMTFLLRNGLEEVLLPDNAEHARFLLWKYYKFVFCVSIPVMVMTTGVVGTSLNSCFANGAIAYVGRASYSVYLWQQLATGVWTSISLSMQLLIICWMIASCLLIYEFVEKPLIRIGRNIASKQKGLFLAPDP